MKTIGIIGACSLALLTACAPRQSAKTDDARPMTLRERLAAVVEDSTFIFGHADDTAYGRTWDYAYAGVNDSVRGRSDVKDVTGDYPGMINWDLGMIEKSSEWNLDSVPFAKMRDLMIEHDARGGINTISWHPRNPWTGGNSWDTGRGDAMPTDTLTSWIGRAADFIKSIPCEVLFRPWHEHTGSWFWWGQDIMSTDEYIGLWHLTRKIFDEKGIDNVLWVYSPDRIATEEQYMERYPGNDYVDIMGADVYCFADADGTVHTDDYLERANRQLSAATKYAKANGKLVALSETGLEGLPSDDWWTGTLLPLCEKYPVAFVVVWRNSAHKANHFYAPYKGQRSAADFVKFYNSPKTLFNKETAEIK